MGPVLDLDDRLQRDAPTFDRLGVMGGIARRNGSEYATASSIFWTAALYPKKSWIAPNELAGKLGGSSLKCPFASTRYVVAGPSRTCFLPSRMLG